MNRQSHLDQNQTPLLSRLKEFRDRAYAGFHTPGHGGGRGISARLAALCGEQTFRADLPELPELDNLFAAEGVIQESQQLAAAAFGAEQSWFLANGSTAGIEAAILATCNPGEKLILPRNAHRSAISGLILAGAIPVFLQPDYDPVLDLAYSIAPQAVALALKQHPDATAILMVSPTYYGTCGDVAAIAHLAHQHGLPLIVDEAHGAHFAFHPNLPAAALTRGADVVVQSTHKTLPALTQAAMLHAQGSRLDRDRLSKALALVQSSSPNYLLLASLDAARHQMATEGQARWTATLHLAQEARSRLSQIPGLSLLCAEQATTPGFVDLDLTRLTLKVTGLGLDGFTADDLLHTQYNVTAELPTLQNLTFLLNLGNTPSDIDQLIEGLAALARGRECKKDSGYRHKPNKGQRMNAKYEFSLNPAALSPREAFFAVTETVPLAQAINRISAELICPYPPGIPVLIPGELVTQMAVDQLQEILAAGGIISGSGDPTLKVLKVVKR
jgi:arginine decarboxylase